MAQDIVGGLFGIQQAPDYSAQDYRNAIAMAELGKGGMGRFVGGMLGSQLGRTAGQAIGSLLGVEDPRLQQASAIREAQQQGFDVTQPEGLQQLAQFFVQRGQPGLASQVAQQAKTMSTQMSEQQLKQAQIIRTEALAKREDANLARQDKLEQVMQELGPNATPKQIQQAIFPYLSSEEKVKLLTSKYAMGTGVAVGGGGDGTTITTGAQMGQKTSEGAPYVIGTDKVGRVKLSDGRVIPAAQFYAAQESNNQAQFALDAVRGIDETTVKQAFGSAADYTEIPYGGALRPQTATAQTNIKNLKIKDTLEKLGPLKGATSDREFSTIMSSFPSFTASPKVMQDWLNRAEKYLANRVKTGQKQFGVMETSEPEAPKPTQKVIKLD